MLQRQLTNEVIDMGEEKKKESVLAGVAKLFRPNPAETAAPPPSCCGECGGEKKKTDKNEGERK